jgi:hypothetical protein
MWLHKVSLGDPAIGRHDITFSLACRGLGVSTLQDPPSKNLRVGHPAKRYENDLTVTLKGFEDFDVACFAEDVDGDACGIAVDDYVAVGAGDA